MVEAGVRLAGGVCWALWVQAETQVGQLVCRLPGGTQAPAADVRCGWCPTMEPWLGPRPLQTVQAGELASLQQRAQGILRWPHGVVHQRDSTC